MKYALIDIFYPVPCGVKQGIIALTVFVYIILLIVAYNSIEWWYLANLRYGAKGPIYLCSYNVENDIDMAYQICDLH